MSALMGCHWSEAGLCLDGGFGHAVPVMTDSRLREPKAHRFPDVIADKMRRVHDPYVAPLNHFVEQINAGLHLR
jgi:hypothetical protein